MIISRFNTPKNSSQEIKTFFLKKGLVVEKRKKCWTVVDSACLQNEEKLVYGFLRFQLASSRLV
jgi:hypothetical protein